MKKILVLLITFLLTSCAHTEKYFHAENTFSINKFINPHKELSNNFPFTEFCADKASIHSPVIWVPIIGPAIDVSMSTKAQGGFGNRLDNAIIFLPLIGPAISFSATSPDICTYRTLVSPNGIGNILESTVTKAQFTYIKTIADENCTMFLNRLESSKDGLEFGKTAISDIGTAASAATAFVTPLGAAVVSTAQMLTNKGAENLAHTYFGGQLIPAIKATIESERKNFTNDKLNSENSYPTTVAETISRFGDYDKLCSVQDAIAKLNTKNH